MKTRRRWMLFWNVAAILVVVLLVRRYDPPFDGSDLLPIRPSIDPAANAYPRYVQLATRLRADLDRDALQPLCAILQDPSRGWGYVGDLVQSNEFVFAELDGLQALPFCQAPDLTSYRTYETNTLQWVDLATFLCLATDVALQFGNPEQATRCALQQARFAGHWFQFPESRGQFYLAMFVQSKAHASMRRIAAAPESSVEHVRTLLRDSLDSDAIPNPFHVALQAEYEIQHNTLDLIHQSHDGAGLLPMCCGLAQTDLLPGWLKGELFYRHHRTKRMLHEYVSVAMDASRLGRVIPDAHRLLRFTSGDPRFDNERPRAYWKANYIGENYVSSQNDFARDYLFWQVHLAQRGLTQAFLAVHLHRKVHGVFPPSLSALYPEFLGEVPLDPFDGSPVHFDPDIPAVFSSWPVSEQRRPSHDAANLEGLPPLTKPERDNGSTVLFLHPPPAPTPRSVSGARKMGSSR